MAQISGAPLPGCFTTTLTVPQRQPPDFYPHPWRLVTPEWRGTLQWISAGDGWHPNVLSPAARGNRQFGRATSQRSAKVHSLALPCPFAAPGRCEKYLNIFGQSACCFLDASHQILLVLWTNHTATEKGACLIPDALLPSHTVWRLFGVEFEFIAAPRSLFWLSCHSWCSSASVNFLNT